MPPINPFSVRQSILHSFRRFSPRPTPKMVARPNYPHQVGLRPYMGFHDPRPAGTLNLLKLIIAANIGVFGAWKLATIAAPSSLLSRNDQAWLAQFMVKHFTYKGRRDLDSGNYHTLLTSVFSHQNLYHILGNMFTLWAFGTTVAAFGIPPLSMAILAIGSGLGGSIGTVIHEATKPKDPRTLHLYLGASGMVMGIGGAAACLAPKASMLIFGVVPMPLWALVGGYFLFDSYYLNSVDSKTGHSGHLGGLAFGLAYYFLSLRRFGGIARWKRHVGNVRNWRGRP